MRWLLYWFVCFVLLSACQKEHTGRKRFRVLDAGQTGIYFLNQLEPTEEWNIIEYLYFYNGGGLAVGDVNNDSLPDLFFTANTLPNALYLNEGQMQFKEVTQEAGLSGEGNWSTGAAMADVNGDGWLDIYLCQVGEYKSRLGRNELYINNRDGTFSEQAAAYGLDFQGFSTQAAFFDYDRDGDLDCYLLNHSVHSPENYTPSSIRERADEKAGDRLLENQDGKFVDVTSKSGLYSSRVGFGLGVAVSDLNNDGWPDLYISNDFHENDYLYLNQGDGTFWDVTEEALGHTSTFSMGNDIADFNNDGRTDILSLDMKPDDEAVLKASVGADPFNIYQFKRSYGYHHQFPRNMLQLNQGVLEGVPRFSEIGQLAGVAATDWSWTPLFVDMDNDGRKDLFISNGIWRRPNDLDYLNYISNRQVQASVSDQKMAEQMPSGRVPNYAFRQSGHLAFEQVSQSWGLDLNGCTNAAAFADLDLDGDLDLVVNQLNDQARVLENRSRNHQAIRLHLRCKGDNPFGIGSRVEAYIGGAMQVQELFLSRGFQSSTEAVLHFGLGQAAGLDSLHIRWPDGSWQRWGALSAGTHYLRQSEGTVFHSHPAQTEPVFRSYSSEELGLNFKHRENEYNDFDREKLMPHKLSTQGPALAVSASGEALLLYLGGARGQRGSLWRQTEAGFVPWSEEAFAGTEAYEDTDALFFNADNNGRADLLVLSGSGESIHGEAAQPRLYLQAPNGRFILQKKAFPELQINGSCALAFDSDGDGDQDLLLGGRSIPGSYGLPGHSYLLQNDGKGDFTDVTLELAPALRELGMVTDAAFLPDSRRVVLVGEWMPVTFLQVEGWSWYTMPHSHGWWNTVETADVNQDERLDLLLGNLGRNTTLRASPEKPLELFVKDLDQNGTTDPILSYYRGGQRYTVASKDELASQWVGIKKHFPDYTSFARSTFSEVFGSETLRGALHLRAEELASGAGLQQPNGSFVFQPFPQDAQMAPIFAMLWLPDSEGPQLLGAGNWHDIWPSLGRYDASYGTAASWSSEHGWAIWPAERSGFFVPGESRAIASWTYRDERWVALARNDAAPLFFRYR